MGERLTGEEDEAHFIANLCEALLMQQQSLREMETERSPWIRQELQLRREWWIYMGWKWGLNFCLIRQEWLKDGWKISVWWEEGKVWKMLLTSVGKEQQHSGEMGSEAWVVMKQVVNW